MACQKLTEEQLKKHLDEILRMKNDNETMIEKNIALLEWKCRYRQKAYFDAGDMESVADEELRLIKELKTLTVEIPGDNFLPRARARMKVIASTFMAIFRRAGVTMANIDAIRIAELISFLSGFSENGIRQYLKNETSFMPNDLEALRAQALLMAVGITDKIVM